MPSLDCKSRAKHLTVEAQRCRSSLTEVTLQQGNPTSGEGVSLSFEPDPNLQHSPCPRRGPPSPFVGPQRITRGSSARHVPGTQFPFQQILIDPSNKRRCKQRNSKPSAVTTLRTNKHALVPKEHKGIQKQTRSKCYCPIPCSESDVYFVI